MCALAAVVERQLPQAREMVAACRGEGPRRSVGADGVTDAQASCMGMRIKIDIYRFLLIYNDE